MAHPTEPGLIYARTDTGCVYRWNAASAQWIPLTDFHSLSEYNPKGPESIALDASDPNRLYIAAGMYMCGGCPFAILASTVRGATFTAYNTPFQMSANNDGRPAGERLAVTRLLRDYAGPGAAGDGGGEHARPQVCGGHRLRDARRRLDLDRPASQCSPTGLLAAKQATPRRATKRIRG